MRLLLGVVALVVLLGGGTAVAWQQDIGPFAPAGPQERNVFAERGLYADPDARAWQAAAQLRADGREADADLLEEVAAVPSGIWLVPERHPPGSVGPYVTEVVTRAAEAGEVPLLVLYGVPDRDCSGGFSAGGLDASEYGPWVAEVADAVVATGEVAAVVVEPDALASSVECGTRDERVRLVGGAVDTLVDAGVTTYVDAGHSDWIPAREMARLLTDVGVGRTRGFSTNVSNYQTDADEQAWAQQLSELLGGTHWIIDRGRNGNGATDVWCNPEGRALGGRPGYVEDDTGLDAYLWIKPPAESDGTCNGGPPAGEVHVEQALALAREAGW